MIRNALRGTRLSGIARGTAHRIIVRNKNAKRRRELGRVEDFSKLSIELEDGSLVQVVPARDVVLEPHHESTVSWGDLLDEPRLLELHDSKQLNRSTQVDLERFEIDGSMPLELLVVDEEHAFDEPKELRGAPERRLVRVTARVLTYGVDAESAMDRLVKGGKPRARRPEQSGVPTRGRPSVAAFVGTAVSLGLLLIACFCGYTPIGVDLFALAAGTALLVGVHIVSNRTPIFVPGDKTNGGKPSTQPRAVLGYIVGGSMLSLLLVGAFNDIPQARDPQPVNGSVIMGYGLSLTAALMTIVFFFTRRKSVKLLHVLASAPPFPRGKLVATWGSVDGVVRDPTPVTTRMESETVASAVIHIVEEETQPGSDPSIFVERVLSDGTFFVDAEHGAFEVDPRKGDWASDARVEVRRGPRGSRRIDHVQVIPIGGSVLVAGRGRRDEKETDGHLAANGPESLVMFAAMRGQNARLAVKRILSARRLMYLALALAMGVGAALSTIAQRDLPPFYARPSSD